MGSIASTKKFWPRAVALVAVVFGLLTSWHNHDP